jgi:ubiquinone biosynthesis monooxygenase Coq6
VGADGGASRLRRAAGFRTATYDYHQQGVVATVELEEPGEELWPDVFADETTARGGTAGDPFFASAGPSASAWRQGAGNTTAWQRFLPTGPIALLPAGPRHANVVWSTTPAHAEELLALPDADFGAAVCTAFGRAGAAPLGEGALAALRAAGALLRSLEESGGDSRADQPRAVRAVGARGAFPLRATNAAGYVSHRHRLALVGDAAHTVHPLAGQAPPRGERLAQRGWLEIFRVFVRRFLRDDQLAQSGLRSISLASWLRGRIERPEQNGGSHRS